MKPRRTIIDAVQDKHLFGPWFKDRNTWQSWIAFLAALFALPMTDEQLAIYKQCTARTEPPTSPAAEGWLVCGRRGGKSFILAVCAVYLACFRNYRQHLARGERGTILVVAVDRKQARVILRYIKGLLTGVPMLARMIERETTESFDLTNHVTVEIHTASFRSARGYTIVGALLDELAFWHGEESTDPDTEIIAAIRPGMATIPGAMLLCASSPYGRRGALWEAHRKHFARENDPCLVWQAATRTMNPTIAQSIIDAAMEEDPSSASAEYMAEFRSDIEGFVMREVVEVCTALGVYERGPLPGVRYHAFVDPSGGSRDSFTLAVAHKQDEVTVIDCLREVRPPFSPEGVVAEFATMLRAYRIGKVTGDRYAGEFPREQFRKHGVSYEVSAQPKSDIYVNFLPLLNSRKVELLDHPRLISQLTGLERRTSRAGKDSIDHAPGSHDDLANAAAGVLTLAQRPVQHLRMFTIADGCAGQNFQQVEIDVATGRPMQQRTRLRWINCDEQGRVLKSRYG